MEQPFASLSKRQTMLLLTAVTFGGSDCVGALEHLPPEEAELLKFRASELLQIPREKRIPLLVQEIKRLVTSRRGQLWAFDPERLAEVLRRERPALVDVVLKALPAGVAEEVRAALPPVKHRPSREVKPWVLSIVRWKLDELLGKAVARKATFKFVDILNLQPRELLTLCDRMGARALATALAGVAAGERDSFLQALPPDQRDLASRAAAAGESRKLPEERAHAVLESYGAHQSPKDALRNAGAQRIARACLAQSPEFAARLVERHGGELGRLLARWVRQERGRAPRGDGGRADLVEQMERLAQKGMIERPVRLPPATKSPPRLGLPGGKLLPPIPRPPRDPIAEREARRAGLAGPRSSELPRANPRVLRQEPGRASTGQTGESRAGRGRPTQPRGVIKGPGGGGRGPKDGSE